MRNKKNKNKNKKGRSAAVTVGKLDSSAVGLSYMPVFPSSIRRRLTYYDTGNLTVTSGTLNYTVFSANGLYDPNISGIGHQPTGFDQMMVFFDHYVVVSCRATVNWFNTSSASSAQVALLLNSSNSLTSSYTEIAEGGYSVREFMGALGSTDSVKTSRLSVNIPKFAGTPNVRDATDLWGTIGSNPNEQTYFDLAAWDFQGGSPAMRYEILLEYDAWFLEPRKLSSSLTAAFHRLILADEKKVATK